MRFGTVILAAGASVRMGRPKLLLPWGDKTILAHLIDQWAALGAGQIAVVVEAKSAVDAELRRFPRVDRIVNPTPEQGMFSSVQSAARWDRWQDDLTHFVITLGDQPHVRLETLQATIAFAESHPQFVCQPARNSRRRHPVVLPRAVFFDVRDSKAANLKDFLAAKERGTFESEDAGLDLDLDTMEDYQRALGL